MTKEVADKIDIIRSEIVRIMADAGYAVIDITVDVNSYEPRASLTIDRIAK